MAKVKVSKKRLVLFVLVITVLVSAAVIPVAAWTPFSTGFYYQYNFGQVGSVFDIIRMGTAQIRCDCPDATLTASVSVTINGWYVTSIPSCKKPKNVV